MRTFLCLALYSAASIAFAQANPCSAAPEARAALAAFELDSPKATIAEKRKFLATLAERFPEDAFTLRRQMDFYRWTLPGEFPAFRSQMVAAAEKNPENPLKLSLAAKALSRYQSPKAIELAERVLTLDPGYPWAHLQLADIRQAGAFADKAKASASFAALTKSCQGLIPEEARYLMGKVALPETQLEIARATRAKLQESSDPLELRNYEFLWGLEFRTIPTMEHSGLRERIAMDVKRIESLDITWTAGLRNLLKNGAKQSGASPEMLRTYEDRIRKDFTRSYPAYTSAYEQWRKANPEPEDHGNIEAWKKWKSAYAPFLKAAVEQYEEVDWLAGQYNSLVIEEGIVSAEEAVSILRKQVLESVAKEDASVWAYAAPAELLLSKGLAKEQALAWAKLAWPRAELDHQQQVSDDTATAEQKVERAKGWGYRGSTLQLNLEALLANRAKGGAAEPVPASIRALVEAPILEDKPQIISYYQFGRARLALLDGKIASALAYYQAALRNRGQDPKPWRGRVDDRLLKEARSLFLAEGGNEESLALFLKAPAAAEKTEGRWDKPKKDLPAFELSTLSGQTYKLQQFAGKALLINLWATWCGPCREELPKLQKLYEATKARQDVQVLTFNIDEEAGLVEPYMKENGYTFPVLLAYSFTRNLLDGIAIPQNWVIDPKGAWRWTQIGFDGTDPAWVDTIIQKMESVKGAK